MNDPPLPTSDDEPSFPPIAPSDTGSHDDEGNDDGDHGEGDGDDSDIRWITVATFWKPTDAQIARLRIESEGIDVILLDENLVATDWLYANAIGGIKLQVPEPSAATAHALLARPTDPAADRNDGQPVSDGQVLCPRCGSRDIYPTSHSRRLSFVALFVSALLLPLALGRRTRCAACGYEWR